MKIFKNWKPKTVLGKVLKGATIGLGVAATAATGIGAVAGVIGGGGLLAGAVAGGGTVVKAIKGVAKGVKVVTSKVAGSAINLVTGTSKEQRDIVQSVKKEAKEAQSQQKLVQKLMNLGKSRSEAESLAGVQKGETVSGGVLSGIAGFLSGKRNEVLQETGGAVSVGGGAGLDPKLITYAGLALAGLFLLPKILRK
jgi:hypothetical protein